MTVEIIVAALIVGIAVRIRLWRRRRARAGGAPATRRRSLVPRRETPLWGDVGLVAGREIRERVRGRIFQVGTVIVLLIVVGAVVIPSLHGPSSPTVQSVGVVGPVTSSLESVVQVAGQRTGDQVRIVPVSSESLASQMLVAGTLDVAVINSDEVLLNEPAASKSSPADPLFVQELATYLGVLRSYHEARLTPSQESIVSQASAVPVRTLRSAPSNTNAAPAVIGLVLIFFMLTQYCSWTLIGVMQEKSSRVVEVLLSTLRPLQLLGGKVLGIGVVAVAQATIVVGAALLASVAVGSDILHGTGPTLLLSELAWFLLGYSFYCWLYAAAGSTAERQDQVQTLAFPLSIPIIVSYVYSITVASSGNPDLAFKVLAYLPPTAPFCMPVLVGLGLVQWWQFALSVGISLVGIVAMAVLAARIYRRAILRTRSRTGLRGLFAMAKK